jgi:hypothetical protein
MIEMSQELLNLGSGLGISVLRFAVSDIDTPGNDTGGFVKVYEHVLLQIYKYAKE